MGLRDRFKKTGGGFLNNVAGIITAVEFTDTPPGDGTKAPSGDFTALFAKLTVRQDGADTPVETHLFAGSADDFQIDGATLTPTGDAGLWGGTAFARFYNSACEKGLEDPETAEGDPLDFSHLVGVRAQFVQVKDEEAMARAAKNAAKSKGKINAQGQRKGKDGKFYDIRTLEVSEIYSTGNAVDAAPAAKSSKAVKAAPKAVSTAKGKPVAAQANDEELRSFAKDIVVEVLTNAKDGKLMKTSLSTGIVKRFNQDDLKGDGRREDVRKIAGDEGFITEMVEEGLITVEKNILQLAA